MFSTLQNPSLKKKKKKKKKKKNLKKKKKFLRDKAPDLLRPPTEENEFSFN